MARAVYLAVLALLCACLVGTASAGASVKDFAEFCGTCAGNSPMSSGCDDLWEVCSDPDQQKGEFKPQFCGGCTQEAGGTAPTNPTQCQAAITNGCTCRQQSVTNAKTKLDDCLSSSVSNDPYTDPYTDGPADVCNCFVLYESYEALLGMCDETPAASLATTFDVCENESDDDGNDNDCDGFLVEGLALAAWKCMGSNIACTCKDQVVAYNTALEACGSDKDQTLVQLVETSCGTQQVTATRPLVCAKCPDVAAVESDKACDSLTIGYCRDNAGSAYCAACDPITQSCGSALTSMCKDCQWTQFVGLSYALSTCLTENQPCQCLTQYNSIRALTSQASNSGCPSAPQYLQTRMAACPASTSDTCVADAVTNAFTALKTCQASNAICDCVTAFGDYAGAAKACGIKATVQVRDEFADCDAASKCAADVGAAFNKVVGCVAVQEDHCTCMRSFQQWSDLVTSCSTGANDKLTTRFATCQVSNTNRPSFVELTTPTYTAAAADGYATVMLRRFGGAGDKASVAGEVTLAAYMAGGRYTGLTVEVEWDEGDMNQKTAKFPLNSGALVGVTSFRVAIVDADGVVVGSVAAATVSVTPAPVTPTITIKYPAAGVVWHQSTTKKVVYSATGFPAGTSFSVRLEVAGASPTAVGVAGASAELSVSVAADATVSDEYTVVVTQVTASNPVTATSAAFSVAAATGGAAPTVAVSLTGTAPYVAWLGKDLSYTLTATSPNPSDDTVVVVAVDASGAVVSVVGRWDVDDVPASPEWDVPRDLPVANTATYMLQAYVLVAGDYYVDSTPAFAAQPPVEFKTGSWSACSEACGAGTQSRSVTCVRVDDGSGDEEDTRDCLRYFTMPTSTMSCFQKPCSTYGWQASEWSACSVTCGAGTQSRTVECVDDTASPVLSSQCTVAIAGAMPATAQACPNQPTCETYKWRTSKWLSCSADCGDGYQLRVVACVGSRGSVSVDGSRCAGTTKPAGRQACNEEACDEFEWLPTRWGSCSAVCGGGTQSRTVSCVTSATGAAAPGQCDDDDKPKTSRNCNKFKCPNQEVKWTYGAWGGCSVTCGGGTATRTSTCVNSVGTAVDASQCTDAGLTAFTSVQCGMAPCDPCDKVTCANGGTCTNGVCSCTSDFKGALCLTPSTCAGQLDGSGSCCASGVVSKAGDCCAPSGAVAPVVDGSGACCASGVVDACRQCDGTGVGYDRSGQCCSGADAVLDGAYRCCTTSELDACGVCFGDGRSCNLQLQLRMKKPAKYTVEDLLVEGSYAQLMYLQNEYPALMSTVLGIPSTRIVGLGVIAVDTTRRLSASAIARLHPSVARVLAASTTEIQVESQILADASSTVAADEVVESLYSASGSGTSDVAAVDSYAAQGVCGNNACEEGETCSSAEDQSCCVADCPFLLQACPVPAGAKEQCGVGGTCNTVTGECTCYSDLGYTGTDCGECVFPYMSDGAGGCFNAQPAALSGTTGGSTTGGSTTGGSTTGGSTTGGNGTGGGGGMPGWAIGLIVVGSIVVLVSAGVIYKFGCKRSTGTGRRRKHSLLPNDNTTYNNVAEMEMREAPRGSSGSAPRSSSRRAKLVSHAQDQVTVFSKV